MLYAPIAGSGLVGRSRSVGGVPPAVAVGTASSLLEGGGWRRRACCRRCDGRGHQWPIAFGRARQSPAALRRDKGEPPGPKNPKEGPRGRGGQRCETRRAA